MAAKSKWGSIFGLYCPRCRTGKMFKQPYTYKTAYQMPPRCPVCDQNYEPEPGFYYGAMFISYILTGWLFMLVGLGLVFGLGWGVTPTLVAVAALTIVVHNLIFRFSRSLWLHFFVKYNPSAREKSLPSSPQ